MHPLSSADNVTDRKIILVNARNKTCPLSSLTNRPAFALLQIVNNVNLVLLLRL